MRKLLSAISNGILEIRYHVLRSSLSLIGIVLGVMNLSAMFSIIDGAKMANKIMMESIGSPDMIGVSLDWRKMRKAVEMKNFRLSWDDVRNIKKYGATVKNVAVEVYRHEQVQYGKNDNRYTIVGVMPSSFPMNKYLMEDGRIVSEFDMEANSRVCVIGSEPHKDLFNNKNPVGNMVKIRGEYYMVIGLMEEFGKYWEEGLKEQAEKNKKRGKKTTTTSSSRGGRGRNRSNPLSWKNRRVLIPATTMQKRLIGGHRRHGAWFSISVQSESADMVPATIDEVRNILVKTHDDQDVFEIRSVQEWQNDREGQARMWQVLLGVVAGISLAVGGVGIMNVMLASFRERVREIGIRKAIGATNMDIFLLFIVETIVICFIGGLIGLGLGYTISMTALRNMLIESMGMRAEFSVGAGIFAVAFSVVIGVISGMYPAIKAAKLAPVEALRYE